MVNTGKHLRISHRSACNLHIFLFIVFSVLDPDGTLRTVKYTADDHNGFQAQVLLNGKPMEHAQPPAPHYPQHGYGGGGGGGGGDDEDSDGDDDEDDEYYRK